MYIIMKEKIVKIFATLSIALAIAVTSSVVVSCAGTYYDVTVNYTVGDGTPVEETYVIYTYNEPSVDWSFSEGRYALSITFYEVGWRHKEIIETTIPVTLNSFNVAKK